MLIPLPRLLTFVSLLHSVSTWGSRYGLNSTRRPISRVFRLALLNSFVCCLLGLFL